MFPLLRKIRTAGWSLIYSLHRASYDQMPTFLRDMVSMMTMGCNSWDAARFGLSPVQIESDACHPEMWADDPDHRGKFYLHAPVLDKAHRLMAGRFWDWGPGTRKMTEHAAKYPAAERPWDEVTLPLFLPLLGEASPVPRQPAAASRAPAPATAAVTEEDDDMDDRYDEDMDDLELPLGAPADQGPKVPVSPELALRTVRDQIIAWRAEGGVPHRGERTDVVTVADLRELAGDIGRSRQWLYQVMPRLVAEGQLRPRGGGKPGWVIAQSVKQAV
jgi:hypothetical protein